MKVLFTVLRYSGLPFLFRELIQRNKVSILMFHDIDRRTARRSFRFLARKYNIISLQHFLQAHQNRQIHRLPRKAMVITFDDGHKGNYEIFPVLKELGIPVTIFLCSGVVNTRRHYWFKENKSEHSTEALKKLPNRERLRVLAEHGFDQEKQFEDRQALNKAEILEMKDFIDFQAHTVFHPCLPTCTDPEALQEIEECKFSLNTKFGLQVNAFAFPNGDYSDRDISLLKRLGYDLAVTVDHGFNDASANLFRLKRLSSNDTPHLDELIVKASGLWGFIKGLMGKTPKHDLKDPVTQPEAPPISVKEP